MKFDKQLICVSGLPRSGSTLLCQLLSHHSDLYCPGHGTVESYALG
ncbi:MAG: sulfotransferase, partial [Cyanobacteria bacterium J06607_6]